MTALAIWRPIRHPLRSLRAVGSWCRCSGALLRGGLLSGVLFVGLLLVIWALDWAGDDYREVL